MLRRLVPAVALRPLLAAVVVAAVIQSKPAYPRRAALPSRLGLLGQELPQLRRTEPQAAIRGLMAHLWPPPPLDQRVAALGSTAPWRAVLAARLDQELGRLNSAVVMVVRIPAAFLGVAEAAAEPLGREVLVELAARILMRPLRALAAAALAGDRLQ
jgi:hypothetical protein